MRSRAASARRALNLAGPVTPNAFRTVRPPLPSGRVVAAPVASARPYEMTDFWIGSDEYPRWWAGQPARVIRRVETDGETGLDLMLVEIESPREQTLLGRHIPMAVKPGRPVGILEFNVPEGWDGSTPIAEGELRFRSEPVLYAQPQELPVVSIEHRERIRRGWGLLTTRCRARWRGRPSSSTPTSTATSCARSRPRSSSCRCGPTRRPADPACGPPPTRTGGR